MAISVCQRPKPISISLSPNTEKDDIRLALKLIFQPWKWKRGKAPQTLEEEFKKYLGIKSAFAFNSGRSSLLAILKSLNLPKGSEILLQAFTCNAAVNPVLWAGMKPVYVDCDENTFNIDVDDLKRKITPGSKVLMVQHTFGIPAQMDKISETAAQNNLILVEDCAHALGAEFQNKKAGTFGKAAFFSFSRDKIISSVYGGVAVTNDEALAANIKKFQEQTKNSSSCWVLQQLLHPVLMNLIILPSYAFLNFGKYLLVLFQWLHIFSKAVHWREKRGKKPSYFPKRMPNALALLALNQFKKLDRFNSHRQKLADYYFNNFNNSDFRFQQIPTEAKPVFLRFALKNPKAHEIIKKCWQKNILIGDWYATAIAPYDTNTEKMKYQTGICPKAEALSNITFNLPTHINFSPKEAERLTIFLKQLNL